ncbi:MAG: 2-hydroxyacyl-CoA dehydratase subunit D [Eggerthellaceae bacterium]
MDVVQTFGNIVSSQAEHHPERAERILYAGWRAQLLNLTVHPDKRLPAARQYAARIAMQKITQAMRHPENAAAISLFTPYEPLHAAGILPFSVEQMSCFIGGSDAEQKFLELAGDAGFSDTMCSYHRVFLGTAASNLMPKPRFTVYTTLVCDGNLITFPYIQRHFDIPGFCIDVPYEQNEDAVQDVAGQLRLMVQFVEDCTGRRITDEALTETVARGWQSALNYRRFLRATPGKRLPADMTNEMYALLMNHVLIGSPETATFCNMLADEMEQAPASDGLRLVWVHTMPFSQAPLIERINFNDDAFVTACDLAVDPMMIDIDPQKPYEAMARRLVYSSMNGPTENRVKLAVDLARETEADGVVLYNHWGCKATLGASRLIKQGVEAAGYPCLLLDGDGVDVSNRSDGQTSTRFDAFLELLHARRARAQGGRA